MWYLTLYTCPGGVPFTCKQRPQHTAGFVEEMRFVAMRLHTRDQAPKEGEREAAEQAWKQVSWYSTCLSHRILCSCQA